MKPVSASTERALRAALHRLVSGNPTRTDGRLTIANLAREAGLGRATANRAGDVAADLRSAAAGSVRERRSPPRLEKTGEEQTRRALEDLLAQHAQARALLRREEERRVGRVVSLRQVGADS